MDEKRSEKNLLSLVVFRASTVMLTQVIWCISKIVIRMTETWYLYLASTYALDMFCLLLLTAAHSNSPRTRNDLLLISDYSLMCLPFDNLSSFCESDTFEISANFESRDVLVFSRFCAQSRSNEPLHCVMAYFCPLSRFQEKCIFTPTVLMLNKQRQQASFQTIK